MNPWVGKIPWRRQWLPTLVFLPGKSDGQRRLVGCSPWGRKSRTRLKRLTLHFHFENFGKAWSLLSPDKYADMHPNTRRPHILILTCVITQTHFILTVGGSQIPLNSPAKETVIHSDFFIVQTRAFREVEGLGLDPTAHS